MIYKNLRNSSFKVIRIILCFVLALGMVAGNGLGNPMSQTIEANAKEIGAKNEVQKRGCESVTNDNAPDGYTEVIEGKVFSGGDSYSRTGSAELDNAVTDFAHPLPYGDTFVDTSKLNWNNPSGFIIDIKDDRFKWVSINQQPQLDDDGKTVLYDSEGMVVTQPIGNTLVDALGNKSTSDPFGNGKELTLTAGTTQAANGIFYVGPLKSYHEDIKAAASDEGYTNVIEPKDGAPYLYRITYLNAVILPNGTRGNLVLTMNKVQIESSFTIDEDHPYKPVGANYEYTKALLKVQGANQLSNDTGYNFRDAYGKEVNRNKTLVLTKAEAGTLLNSINKELSSKIADSWIQEKYYRNATGNLLDLDIEVVDAEGNPVNGTIAYAAHDMDFESAQNVWGRHVGNEFGEGMTIVSGSKSYALVPDYKHDLDGNTVATGWLPVGPGEEEIDRALVIEKVAEGNYADGIRFGSPFLVNYRDENGKLENVVYNNTDITSYQGDGLSAGNNIVSVKPGTGNNSISNNNIKKQLYVLMKKKGYTGSWNSITPELAWQYLGNNFWKTYRNDADDSFDSGFAVLIDAKKTQLQWSGSRATGSSLNTALFDSSIFTYVEPTHGTGGGIYIESYDIDNSCATKMLEGSTVTSRNSEMTVTAVPEEGYRVGRILIGDTNYGSESNERGLKDYKTVTIDGNDIKVDGVKVGSFNGNTIDVRGNEGLKAGKVEIDGFNYDKNGVRKDTDASKKIVIERNADGTVDVTLPDIDNPMHVHVDFDTNYNFYKVWKGGSTPEALKMTAAPAGVYPVAVTIPMPTGEYDYDDQGNATAKMEMVDFEIRGSTYTALNGTYEGFDFVLSPNNTVDHVEYETDPDTGAVSEKLAIRSNVVLSGNEFVHYAYVDGKYEIDARYPVTFDTSVADWESDDAKEFVIDAKDPNAAGYVTELDESNTISPGNKVWKVKYPSEGVEALGWPALPVEKLPLNDSGDIIDNHGAANHTDRYYWFVTEEVPGWATETYSNENAEDPGIIHNPEGKPDYYNDSLWVAASLKDKDTAKELIHEDHEYSYAYMSHFENGGEITNEPSIVVRGVKDWIDENNKTNKRKDIWLHLDVNVTTPGGETFTRKDVLPPQKVAADATGNGLAKNWGTKTSYTTGDTSVKVVASTNKIPSNAILQEIDGKQVYTGPYKYTRKGQTTYYYINELREKDSEGNTYEYSIRETLDWQGNQPVEKDNLKAGLIDYVSEDVADWDEVSSNEDTYSYKYTYNGQSRTANMKRYTGTVENYNLEPPVGTADETYGGKGQSQTGTPTFDITTKKTPDGEDNEIVEVKLLDADGNPTDTVTVSEGTYKLNGDGTVTFTPNDPEYVGNPTPVSLIGTDKNGLSATTTYTPHVVDNTDTVKRTITYYYSDGTPVKDGDGNPYEVVQEVTFVGEVDPKTGEVTFPSSDPNNTQKLPEVTSPDAGVGWIPDKKTVKEETVHPLDDDLKEIVYYNPKELTATPDETYGLKGESQTGKPQFNIQTPFMPDQVTPNEVVKIQLIDPETNQPIDGDTVTIPGQGTYKLNPDGTITFTPEDGYVGNPTPIAVQGTDKLGTVARTTYTPHVKDPQETGTAERNIHYTYETKDGEKVTDSIKQTLTLTRHATKVDPKTGEVLEWGEWSSGTFPAVENPDDEAGAVWYTNDKVDELTVNKPGTVPDEHVVYLRKTIWVTYVDEDGTTIYLEKTTEPKAADGEEQQEPTPPKDPTKKGYTFEGWDREVDEEGNITYTARWEPKTIWVTYIDENGKKIFLEKTNVPAAKEGEEQEEPTSPKNPTKDGYIFEGWDREVDEDGNITYIARWKPKTIWVIYIDENGNTIYLEKTTEPKAKSGEAQQEPTPPTDPTKEGYTFAGWKREVDEEGNIIYIATWEPIPVNPSGKPVVNTSDNSNTFGYTMMFALSTLIVMAGAFIRKRYQ